MVQPVTDPDLLKKLNAPEPVTDPGLLAKLNSVGGVDTTAAGMMPSRMPDTKRPVNPIVDYENDIPDIKFRAGLSFMRNDRQRQVFLDKTLGQGNWGLDEAGTPIVSPAGLARLGIKSDKARPIDKAALSNADIADLSSHVPPVLGGIGGSLAATGVGTLPGLALAAGGAALGQAGAEGVKAVAGYPATPAEAAGAIGEEALGAGVGEGAFRFIRGTSRKALNPGARYMTPPRTALLDEALKRGYIPKPGQITGSNWQSRAEGVVNRMFGDTNLNTNVPKAMSDLGNLRQMTGAASASPEAVGEKIAQEVVARREVFGKAASARYQEIDALVGGQPIVPTSRVRDWAQQIIAGKPVSADGRSVALDAPTLDYLQRLANLPDAYTTTQMQQLRMTLRDRGQIKNLAPGLSSFEYRMLAKAADGAFDDAAKVGFPASMRQSQVLGPNGQPMNVPIPARPPTGATADAITKLREADEFYKHGIRQFDYPFLGNITKDQNLPGAVDPDAVLDYAIRPGHAVRARRVMAHLSEGTRQQVRRSFANDLTASALQKGEDPFTTILTGGNFEKSLDKYGKDTLNAVMGEEWTTEAYRVANLIKLVTSGNKQSGGLVIATAMLHPLENLGKIAAYRVYASALANKAFLRYMTTGIANPTSKAGKAALVGMENMLRAYTQAGPAAVEEVADVISND